MYNLEEAITEYEYVLHALDEGVAVDEIRQELSRFEREGTSSTRYGAPFTGKAESRF